MHPNSCSWGCPKNPDKAIFTLNMQINLAIHIITNLMFSLKEEITWFLSFLLAATSDSAAATADKVELVEFPLADSPFLLASAFLKLLVRTMEKTDLIN